MKSKTTFGAVVLLAIASTPSYAQVADKRASSIEEVIVTARKVEESLQDTPVSVAAFSSSDLEQMGASEAKDVANFTPNLRMQKQSGSQDNYAMAIRGVSSGETALTIDPTVGVYMDGVYLARSTGLAFDIVDLKRIEVLRGPQGTLFGRNTIGGALNIITEKPNGEPGFKLALGVGDHGYDRVMTSFDSPDFGNLAFKFSYMKNSSERELESLYSGKPLGDAEGEYFRLATRWKASDTVAVDYIYDKSDRESNANTQQLSHVRAVYADPNSSFYGGPYYEQAEASASQERQSVLPFINTDPAESNSDIDSHSITVEWDVSENLLVKSISNVREWNSKARGTEFGAFPVQNPGDVVDLRDRSSPSNVPVGTLVPLFSATRDNFHRQITQEFQFTGKLLDERLSYTAGIYLFHEEATEDNPQQFVLPTRFIATAATGATLPPIGVASNATWLSAPFAYEMENESRAVYGQFTYNLFTDFDITLGLRYTEDEKESTLQNNLDGASSAVRVTSSDEWNNFSPSFSLDYRWSDQVSTYLRIANGYRSGGYNVRAQTSSSFSTPFDPEEITSYEVGIKSDLFERSLRLNMSLFRMDYTDRQIAQFEAGSGGASSVIVNAGESVTQGLEIESVFIPSPGVRLIANYGYLDVEYKEFISGPVDPVTGFSAGANRDVSDEVTENLYAPEHSGAVAIEYQPAPWSFGQMTFRLDATYVDSISFHPQLFLYDQTEAYTLVNARATLADIPLADGRLRVALWGKNLTDKEYREFGIDFGLLGFAVNNYGVLRRAGIDIVYQFGE
ncbi:TonB-dependent receptor [Litorivivens sp.]|uniref:TonB-dependent receptor n=1 Tax=Litorivivens sp. TaxID=2020868 RepID=UPI003569251B